MDPDADMNSILLDVLPNMAANATTAVVSSVGDHLTGLSSIAGGFHDAMLDSAAAAAAVEPTQSVTSLFDDGGGGGAFGLVGDTAAAAAAGSMQFFTNATTQVGDCTDG